MTGPQDTEALARVLAALDAALRRACETSSYRWPQQEDLPPIADAVLAALAAPSGPQAAGEGEERCSTCGEVLDAPPCSLNRDIGWSGHTRAAGLLADEAIHPPAGVPADRARDEEGERLRAENDRLAAQNARQAVTVAQRQQSWDEMRRERDALRARIEIQRQTLEGLGAHTDEQTAALTCVAALLAKWQAEADDPDGYDALLFADAAAQLRAALDAQ